MQHENRDTGFLWDMREAARETIEFTQGVAFADFVSNRIFRYAAERQLAVIGEAARQVSAAFRQVHPEIPWDVLISRRNIIIHNYGEIMAERIWRVITNELPRLLITLNPLIPTPPDDPTSGL